MVKAEKLIVTKKLPTYEIGANGVLRPVMLMNEFQTFADAHAAILGVGREYCAEHEIGWVVTHYVVHITEMPSDKEEIKIITWPARHEGLKAVRDFEIRGMDGRVMVVATSQWVVLDMKTRRPLRLSDCMPEWEYIPDRALDIEFDKMGEFESNKGVDFRVRYDDIDVNRHVNNSVYTTWATESLGHEFLAAHRLCGLSINFKKEISGGVPKITVFHQTDGNVTRHMIKSGDTTHAVIICDWEAIDNN